jgi:fumarylpyruvate hydrolase
MFLRRRLALRGDRFVNDGAEIVLASRPEPRYATAMSEPAFVIPPSAVPAVPVAGSAARFPVRRIFCVGRNYAEHVKEMGGDPKGEPPLFFTKPADAVVPAGGDVAYPSATKDLHHEVELVIAVGAGGADLDPATADRLIWGWAVGVDLTRRDLQSEAKKGGKPWDAAKAFDASAPIGPITPRSALAEPRGRIRLAVDGRTAQDADLSDMIWKPAEIVAQASRLWRLEPGDLIFTGTPEGVGPLQRGASVDASIDGLAPLRFRIV